MAGKPAQDRTEWDAIGEGKATDAPFHVALRALLEYHKANGTPGMPKSTRQLAAKTRWEHANLSRLTLDPSNRYRREPTLENMKAIAEAFRLPHTYWREYREHLAADRARKVTAEVGLDRVLAALSKLSDDHQSRR